MCVHVCVRACCATACVWTPGRLEDDEWMQVPSLLSCTLPTVEAALSLTKLTSTCGFRGNVIMHRFRGASVAIPAYYYENTILITTVDEPLGATLLRRVQSTGVDDMSKQASSAQRLAVWVPVRRPPTSLPPPSLPRSLAPSSALLGRIGVQNISQCSVMMFGVIQCNVGRCVTCRVTSCCVLTCADATRGPQRHVLSDAEPHDAHHRQRERGVRHPAR
jgi:hypothetical protein